MAFDYDPNDKTEAPGTAEPGRYQFKIDQVTEKTFRTGSNGWEVKLLVAALPDKDITVYENIVNIPKCLFKMEELCQSVGYDFGSPPKGGWQPHQFEGRGGWGTFKKQKNSDYLEVDELEPAKAGNVATAKGDDVPF